MTIVALNSGGFDSVLMLRMIRDENPNAEIHTLFFDYGQNNAEQEGKCAEKSSTEERAIFHRITIPKFSWSSEKGMFNHSSYHSNKEDYIEMRNLVFLSYAISLCESVSATELYAAILKCGGYKDTSKAFIDKVNSLASLCGVSFRTPFCNSEKLDLAPLAFKYDMKPEDYFSCNHPNGNQPCGVCEDCKDLEYIHSWCTIDSPMKWVSKNGLYPDNPEFQALVRSVPLREVRLLTNNSCQLKCDHCYYGFFDMVSPIMVNSEFYSVIDQAVEMGASNFHFSGKEPLFDERIFCLARYIKDRHPGVTYDVVTNGINVPKYASRIKDLGFSRVCLSVDDTMVKNGVRKIKGVTDKAIEALNEKEIPIEMFYDVHPGNFGLVYYSLKYLYLAYGVTKFYVRTIMLVGNAEKNNIKKLGPHELDSVYKQVDLFTSEFKDVFVTFSIGAPYVYDLFDSEACILKRVCRRVLDTCYPYVKNNLFIWPEVFCGKYQGALTVTPDGYVHGCASECSVCEYHKEAVGNVRDASLRSLYAAGKERAIQDNMSEIDEDGSIKFYSCPFNPID